MKNTHIYLLGCCLATGIFGCDENNEESSSDTDTNTSTDTDTETSTETESSTESSSEEDLDYQYEGCDEDGNPLAKGSEEEPEMCYSWEYLSTDSLKFNIDYLPMLCGTEWEAALGDENGAIVINITEINNPECEDTGCECSYYFDFEIPYSPVSLGVLDLKVRLNSCGEMYLELPFTIDLAEQSSGTTCD